MLRLGGGPVQVRPVQVGVGGWRLRVGWFRVTHGTLAEPGILLRMMPGMSPVLAEVDGGGAPAVAPVAGSRPAAGSRTASASVWALAGAWLVLDVVRTQRGLGQLSSPMVRDWLPFAGAAVGGFAAARSAGSGERGRETVGLLAAGVLTVATLVALALPDGEPGGVSLRLLLQAHGLGLVLGAHATAANGRAGSHRWPLGIAVVAAALFALGGALVWPLVLDLVGSDGASVGSLVMVVLATAMLAAPPRATPVRGLLPRRHWFAGVSLWLAATSMVCLAAPAALWNGGGAEAAGFCALIAVVGCTLAARAWVVALGAAAAGAAMAWLATPMSVLPGDGDVLLAAARHAAVVYRRATQELQLFDGGQLVDAAGPDHREAELTATVLAALLAPGDRVLVLGQGTGRLPSLLVATGRHEVEVADGRPAAGPLRRFLQADGPVVMPGAAATEPASCRVRVSGLHPALARLPDASRQALVLAEPLSAASGPQVTVATQAELRRVVGNGLVVQVLSLDRSPADLLRALFRAAVLAHPWNAVFAVGDGALLLSAASAPAWPAPANFESWSEDARWIAHGAHLGDLVDVQRACLGTLRPVVVPAASSVDEARNGVEGERGRLAALAVLHDHLEPAAAVDVPLEGSVLSGWTALQAGLRAAAARLHALGTDAAAHAAGQAVAATFLPVGAPTAMLQAALGLPAADGVSLRDPSAASLRAHAIDPTFFSQTPPVFANLPLPRQRMGELEDVAQLPAAARLREWCAADTPRAVALRARFGSRCARVLVQALGAAPLSAAESQALRELVDPFVLREAGCVLRRRGAVRELLALWRGDLPMPTALNDLLRGAVEDRRALAAALPGRRDAGTYGVLADLLVAPEHELRSLAGAALRQIAGDRVPYDPDWPSSALNQAADRWRALHNRNP